MKAYWACSGSGPDRLPASDPASQSSAAPPRLAPASSFDRSTAPAEQADCSGVPSVEVACPQLDNFDVGINGGDYRVCVFCEAERIATFATLGQPSLFEGKIKK